jgi:hypothetical protein
MTIEKMLIYYCSRCGKKFPLPTKRCDCEKEEILSWAKLLSEKDSANYVKVQCLICGREKTVAYYNIVKVKSCGCVPRNIIVISVNETEVRYQCNKCGDISIEKLPCTPSCECGK